ncbi:MAG TPA: arginase [Planctomycetes bacterium]|nr:arginase [Planctomycetota bacterium]HIN81178.1 arginase [Planctomycetota bacterium]
MSNTSQKVELIGAPVDHGAGRRGVSMAPAALRIARLRSTLKKVGVDLIDSGDISVPLPELNDPGDPAARYLPVIKSVCQDLCKLVSGVLDRGALPLVIGGDHSIAIGTISGAATYLHDKDPSVKPPKVGVLWFDAHADLNTPETSPTGNIHGMPVSILLGQGPPELVEIGFDGAKVDPSRFVQIGLRDLDLSEQKRLKELELTAYTMEDIDRRGLVEVTTEAIAVATRDVDVLHVSFDIDVLDPRFAPGTGTARVGGLTYREAHLALEMVADSGRLSSFEMVEVNPILDERNKTAEVATSLIASALGKRIL